MRKTAKVALGCAVLLPVGVVVGIHFGAEPLVRSIAIRTVEDITGFGVEVGDVEVRLRGGSVAFEDARLINPDPFPPDEAVRVRRLYAEPTWRTVFGKETWFRVLEIDIPSVTLLRPADGVSNLERLADNARAWNEARDSADASSRVRGAAPAIAAIGFRPTRMQAGLAATESSPDLRIDRLTLRLGTLTVIDHKLGRFEPVTFTYEVNREETYKGVTDLAPVLEDLVVDLAVDGFIRGLGELRKNAPDAGNGIRDWLRRATEK